MKEAGPWIWLLIAALLAGPALSASPCACAAPNAPAPASFADPPAPLSRSMDGTEHCCCDRGCERADGAETHVCGIDPAEEARPALRDGVPGPSASLAPLFPAVRTPASVTQASWPERPLYRPSSPPDARRSLLAQSCALIT